MNHQKRKIIKNNFKENYFIKRYKRGFFSKRGDKPFFYPWWIRYLKKQNLLGKDKKIFDYGCGEGYWLKRISQFIEAYGGDVSEYAVKTAKEKSIDIKEVILLKNIKLPYKDCSFDIITIFDVIEHAERPDLLLPELYRVLKNKGIVIISTPNLWSWGRKIKKDNWHGARDSTHINMKTINNWLDLFKSHKFRVLKYGTDLFWDYPYFKLIPIILQKIIFVGINNALFLIKGFTSFKNGENAYFILKKK